MTGAVPARLGVIRSALRSRDESMLRKQFSPTSATTGQDAPPDRAAHCRLMANAVGILSSSSLV